METRISDFLQMLQKDYQKKKVLVITRFGVIYEIYRKLGIPLQPVDNLEIIEVEI